MMGEVLASETSLASNYLDNELFFQKIIILLATIVIRSIFFNVYVLISVQHISLNSFLFKIIHHTTVGLT